MHTLELKIPPPLVALAVALAMWRISLVATVVVLPTGVRLTAAMGLALVGGAFDLAAIFAFRRAGTTVNPMKPHKTSAFVAHGVYRVTRNPMYLGLVFVLAAWAIFLSSPWSLVGPLAFVLYIGRFQIAPEERALLARFGNTYAEYMTKVGRWF